MVNVCNMAAPRKASQWRRGPKRRARPSLLSSLTSSAWTCWEQRKAKGRDWGWGLGVGKERKRRDQEGTVSAPEDGAQLVGRGCGGRQEKRRKREMEAVEEQVGEEERV